MVPFTLAHPAAVLPLRRSRLVLSALIVGSMAPDFEYFFGVARPLSHNMPGIITFTFPVALATLVLYHQLIKWPVISLLPRGMQARVVGPARRFRWFPATRFMWILLSLATGISSHIFLDGFTHPDGWAVLHTAALRRALSISGHHVVHLYLLLQVGATAIGMVMVAIYFVRWYRRAIPEEVALRPQFTSTAKWTIVSMMLATAVALGLVDGAHWYAFMLGGVTHRMRSLVAVTITVTSVGAIEMLGFSLIWRAFAARSMKQERVAARLERS